MGWVLIFTASLPPFRPLLVRSRHRAAALPGKNGLYTRAHRSARWPSRGKLWERKTGFEPATFSLARRCSTTEPLPHGEEQNPYPLIVAHQHPSNKIPGGF